MIDKNLLRLLGKNKKYIFYTVALMILGMAASITITASICRAVCLIIHYKDHSPDMGVFLLPLVTALLGIIVRYISSRLVGNIKDMLGRRVKKELRQRVYNKLLRLGVRSADGMSMAGLTQVSVEGIEQLDLYYSSYLPQFFYAMLSPLILFFITVWIEWQVAVVLLLCVPLIPVSIIAVSRYAKKDICEILGEIHLHGGWVS